MDHSPRTQIVRLGRKNAGALLAALLVGLVATTASAVPITLTFEGLQQDEQILDFYNGGTGSMGSSGGDVGVSFGAGALAAIDDDAGGTGNFANEPSGDTAAFFLSGNSLVMNAENGFDSSFSFYYSAAFDGVVTVYDGLNATGNVLGSVNLVAQGTVDQGCLAPGDPFGYFNCWDLSGVAFAGTAMSVDFSGTADQIGFDNIAFENLALPEPTNAVPEPGAATLFGVGSIVVGMRFRRRASSESVRAR